MEAIKSTGTGSESVTFDSLSRRPRVPGRAFAASVSCANQHLAAAYPDDLR